MAEDLVDLLRFDDCRREERVLSGSSGQRCIAGRKKNQVIRVGAYNTDPSTVYYNSFYLAMSENMPLAVGSWGGGPEKTPAEKIRQREVGMKNRH